MKNKLFLILILVGLFTLFIIIRFVIFDKTNEQGVLRVISSPQTSVFINNAIVGKTPYEEKMKVGEYLIKLIPEGTATNTASWNGKINIYKNAKTFVNRELGLSDITSSGGIFSSSKITGKSVTANSGDLYIETDPTGAIITLDNDEKGVAPLTLENVPKGIHELSVFMPGFFRRTEQINIDSGHKVNAFFKLAIDQSTSFAKALEDNKEASNSATSKSDDKTYVTINNNPEGWLRVRVDGSIDATEAAKIKTNSRFELLDETTGWYKIKNNNNPDDLVSGEFLEGWVSSEYANKE